MWKVVLILLSSASLMFQPIEAVGGAESLPFPGYLPREMILARAPEADNHPNDVYQHLPVRRPVLQEDQIVIYPHHFGFEYGQDPEHKIYEVHNAKELAAQHKHDKKSKHDKHGKHAHHHHHDQEHDHHHHPEDNKAKSLDQQSKAPLASPSFPPKHSAPSTKPSSNSINTGYGAPPPPYPYQAKHKPVFPPRS